jgi:trans-AT polyketide synthase, acyltransferase and oxidoreductase domains
MKQLDANTSPKPHPEVGLEWTGATKEIAFDEAGIREKLLDLENPCYIVMHNDQIGATNVLSSPRNGHSQPALLIAAPPIPSQQLGSQAFCNFHGVQYAYGAGAMAGGIASETLVIALGKEKMLSSFGAGGLPPSRVEAAIHKIKQALPNGPYAFNLLHSPNEPALEQGAVELYMKHQVRTIEASAFLDITPNLVYYRAAGLRRVGAHQIAIDNRIIAKISRSEVASKFLEPAPAKILAELVQQGRISVLQAELAAQVPMADDLTVEADSGGHTDNRPLVCLLPGILQLRDALQSKYAYAQPVRIGAAGGLGTPYAVFAAFMMGAEYVVTGSVNQSCCEANTSQYTKQLLAQAEMADVAMAPAADMFEMGVRLQVLKRGTLFAMRAQKLYDLYRSYASLEEIPNAEREKIEQQIFRRSLTAVWEDTRAFFAARDPEQLAKAEQDSRRKMALVFRWYLGLSSRWSNTGEVDRELDYQIWCGPSMGAFNDWVRGTYLEHPDNRSAVDVAHHLMTGAAYLYRLQHLKLQGLQLPASFWQYRPDVPLRRNLPDRLDPRLSNLTGRSAG